MTANGIVSAVALTSFIFSPFGAYRDRRPDFSGPVTSTLSGLHCRNITHAKLGKRCQEAIATLGTRLNEIKKCLYSRRLVCGCVAAVALANKIARTIWAPLVKGCTYQAQMIMPEA